MVAFSEGCHFKTGRNRLSWLRLKEYRTKSTALARDSAGCHSSAGVVLWQGTALKTDLDRGGKKATTPPPTGTALLAIS